MAFGAGDCHVEEAFLFFGFAVALGIIAWKFVFGEDEISVRSVSLGIERNRGFLPSTPTLILT